MNNEEKKRGQEILNEPKKQAKKELLYFLVLSAGFFLCCYTVIRNVGACIPIFWLTLALNFIYAPTWAASLIWAFIISLKITQSGKLFKKCFLSFLIFAVLSAMTIEMPRFYLSCMTFAASVGTMIFAFRRYNPFEKKTLFVMMAVTAVMNLVWLVVR